MGLFHRDKKNNDDEPDSVQTNSFSDIMNGLQYAVNCAQDTLQNHQIQNLTRLFEGTNANNANTFQSKKIMVGDKTIDIPLIALISHHYLAIQGEGRKRGITDPGKQLAVIQSAQSQSPDADEQHKTRYR